MRRVKMTVGVVLAVQLGCGDVSKAKDPSTDGSKCSQKTTWAKEFVAGEEKYQDEWWQSSSTKKARLDEAKGHLRSMEKELKAAHLESCAAPLDALRELAAKRQQAVDAGAKLDAFYSKYAAQKDFVRSVCDFHDASYKGSKSDPVLPAVQKFEAATSLVDALKSIADDCGKDGVTGAPQSGSPAHFHEPGNELPQANWCWVAGQHEAIMARATKRRDLVTKLAHDKKAQVYAQWTTGEYYKGIVIEKNDKQSWVVWDDRGDDMWVNNDVVKPREGHGLKRDLIGDRVLTAAEKAESEKNWAAQSQQLDQQGRARCPSLHSYADCTNSLYHCSWNSAREYCFYHKDN